MQKAWEISGNKLAWKGIKQAPSLWQKYVPCFPSYCSTTPKNPIVLFPNKDIKKVGVEGR